MQKSADAKCARGMCSIQRALVSDMELLIFVLFFMLLGLLYSNILERWFPLMIVPLGLETQRGIKDLYSQLAKGEIRYRVRKCNIIMCTS